jgi:hypothetical protein
VVQLGCYFQSTAFLGSSWLAVRQYHHNSNEIVTRLKYQSWGALVSGIHSLKFVFTGCRPGSIWLNNISESAAAFLACRRSATALGNPELVMTLARALAFDVICGSNLVSNITIRRAITLFSTSVFFYIVLGVVFPRIAEVLLPGILRSIIRSWRNSVVIWRKISKCRV